MRVLLVTISPQHATPLVSQLLEERLIACANILPAVRAIYRWKGALCNEEEALLILETTAERVELALQRIKALHPYECPKILSLVPESVDPGYQAWAQAETRPIPA